MKNEEIWKVSKVVKNKKGHWTHSLNPDEVAISSRLMVNIIAQLYETHIPQHVKGDLLDLGCGKVPFYGMYKPYAKNIYCIDWENSLHGNIYLDQTCDLNKSVNFPDKSLDTIILSDVLEHIEKPQLLFAEMKRVLRNNGKIILNVPFLYGVHEAPYDYFRYTEFALSKLAAEHNFSVIKMIPFGNAVMVIIDIISKIISHKPILGKFTAKTLQSITILLKSKVYKHTAFPLGYFLILQKTK